MRELKHVIERTAILSDGPEIASSDLPSDILGASKENAIENSMIGSVCFDMKEIEKYMISCALKKTMGNQTKAAKLLGVSRRTLLNKMKQPEFVNEK